MGRKFCLSWIVRFCYDTRDIFKKCNRCLKYLLTFFFYLKKFISDINYLVLISYLSMLYTNIYLLTYFNVFLMECVEVNNVVGQRELIYCMYKFSINICFDIPTNLITEIDFFFFK